MNIKREEEEEAVEPPVTTVVQQQTTPPPVVNLNHMEDLFNEVARTDWIKGKDEPMMRPSWVRRDCHDYFESDDCKSQEKYETDQEYDSTENEDEDSQSKRERSHYAPSYFDKARKDDDEGDHDKTIFCTTLISKHDFKK